MLLPLVRAKIFLLMRALMKCKFDYIRNYDNRMLLDKQFCLDKVLVEGTVSANDVDNYFIVYIIFYLSDVVFLLECVCHFYVMF